MDDIYCKVCTGCGEDGCCSAFFCTQEGGSYCETYLKDLKFGYLMYKDMYELIVDEENKKKLDEIFDKNWDIVYSKNNENDN